MKTGLNSKNYYAGTKLLHQLYQVSTKLEEFKIKALLLFIELVLNVSSVHLVTGNFARAMRVGTLVKKY